MKDLPDLVQPVMTRGSNAGGYRLELICEVLIKLCNGCCDKLMESGV